MSFTPVKIDAQKAQPNKSHVDFQQVIGPHTATAHHVVIINSVEVNILLGMKQLPKVHAVIEKLKMRSDVSVEVSKTAWLIRIAKAEDIVCEVTVPIDWCFEWFVSVRRKGQKEEVWSDRMEHYGAPDDRLDAEMANDLLAFIDRAIQSDVGTPIYLCEERA